MRSLNARFLSLNPMDEAQQCNAFVLLTAHTLIPCKSRFASKFKLDSNIW